VTEASFVADTDLVDVEAPVSCRHVNLAILALAIGGFAIGTTEFVTMGLPDRESNQFRYARRAS
jgi:DHA1 family inner membrane transport protein